MLSITVASAPRRAEVAEFYGIEGPRRSAGPSDRVLIAEIEGRLVGAVRLCEEKEVCVLRTMRVAASHRGQGIGRRLLEGFVRELGSRECYLLGYARLEGFYGRAGFMKIGAVELPPHLQERLRRYLEERPDVVPMRRAASASPAT